MGALVRGRHSMRQRHSLRVSRATSPTRCDRQVAAAADATAMRRTQKVRCLMRMHCRPPSALKRTTRTLPFRRPTPLMPGYWTAESVKAVVNSIAAVLMSRERARTPNRRCPLHPPMPQKFGHFISCCEKLANTPLSKSQTAPCRRYSASIKVIHELCSFLRHHEAYEPRIGCDTEWD